MKRAHKPWIFTAIIGIFLCVPMVAQAAIPGGGPLESFGRNLLDFLTAVLGPIVFGLGLVGAAYTVIAGGSRDGLQRCIYALVGGAILFSIGPITEFLIRAVR